MVNFTKEDTEWLRLLIEESTKRTEDKFKIEKLNRIKKNIVSLSENPIKITVTSEQLENVREVIGDLQELTENYSSCFDISALEEYDLIKKKITSKLQFLATYKDVLGEEVNYLEEVLKKEKRVQIMVDIRDSDGVSLNQADKLVEADTRYTLLRDQVNKIKRIAVEVKTKYAFYSQVWSMCFQSVSTAAKEKHASKNNND